MGSCHMPFKFPVAVLIGSNPANMVESLSMFVNAVLPGSELQHLEGGIPREYIARLYNEYASDIVRKLGYPIVESPNESITTNPI